MGERVKILISMNRDELMRSVFVITCLSFFIATGCSQQKDSAQKAKPHEDKSITIGLIPEQNIFRQLDRYEPLAAYLSKKTGTKIKLKILSRYGNIIDNFAAGKMDGAFFGSFTYALANAKLGVEVLVRPEDSKGTSTYHGLLLVRKDSPIRTAGDMRGKRFAFVDRATTAGYLFPLAFFREHGIQDYRTYLKEVYFAGTHEDVIYDVLNKSADVGAAKNTVFDRLAQQDSRIRNELLVLEQSPDVPENGFAVKKDLDADLKKKLKEALLNMHADPEGKEILNKFGAQKFIETTDKEYTAVFTCAKGIGIDLAVYDYLNN